MNLKIPKKFGKRLYEFTVSGDNLFETLMEAEKLSFPSVKACGLCNSDNLRLRAYTAKYTKNGKPQQADYIKIECGECRSSLTFGRRQDDQNTYFLRKTESGELDWQPYKGNGTTNYKSELQKKVVMSQEEANDLNIDPEIGF